MNAGLCSPADGSDHVAFIRVPSFYYSGAVLEAMVKSALLEITCRLSSSNLTWME